MKNNQKVRMGMIGGGSDAFIGAVHRMAANLDGQIELVCGVFSSDPTKSKSSALGYFIEEGRGYSSVDEMLEKETSLPEKERMQFVTIVTPNFLHYEQALKVIKSGFHVVCDKPVALTSAEAKELAIEARDNNVIFALTHNYTGYPMVKQAREMIKVGELGKLSKVVVEYTQGWLSDPIEKEGQKQASWRTDPEKAGISCCLGDIGTHAENLLEYVSGKKITSLCADLSSVVEGRQLDDDGNILIRMEGGIKGVLFASQIAAGEDNELKIRIYGEKGGLEWLQSTPHELMLKWKDAPMQLMKAGVDKTYLSNTALAASRLPGGHPEGYIEAFANLYTEIVKAIKGDSTSDYPTIDDGVRGMVFLEKAVESSQKGSVWVNI